ncbi:UDP-glucose--hexose-1-phosphate uridylyltransferase [Alkalicoccus luteus]|uniref:Galactose-1-phosphate uridylyltransferase n=1 Tax=Alkalicoccus luteus TaxID=1237094 RepID=A0A969PRX5_9BACI|nr:UDP-glucose--hexose-1-phosphate uridylyltransferase [Alkalicoccus luteus]NJP39282.1 UDP-glucose--hexose-1-phosphate uridylyltransferase [Alkalicoccus luteus]
MSISRLVEELTNWAVSQELIEAEDHVYCRNQLLEKLHLNDFQQPESVEKRELHSIMEDILDWASEQGRIESNTITERDLFDTKLMGVFADKPSRIIKRFVKEEKTSPEQATAWFYEWNKAIDYIRTKRIEKNVTWKTDTAYGALDMTINLSKPEKDPAEIEKLKHQPVSSYPLCLLCRENEGYAGRLNHPARQNLRTIPVTLNGEAWHFQFSPYVYYHEHAIVLKQEHEPMVITGDTFTRLLAFTERFPHYFIGSNADLPIVGGSILSHDHYQAGYYTFPMARAEVEEAITMKQFPGVTAGRVKWPMSVVRLQGEDRKEVSRAAEHVLKSWRTYSDESAGIYAETDGTPHQTITPIARRRGDAFELDLVLRNNRTSSEHPDGIFHPHAHVHHIKKENIGLIEVMGLAVLPGRLKQELRDTAEKLAGNHPEATLYEGETAKHADWALTVSEDRRTADVEEMEELLQEETGLVFAEILEHAGVFKRDEAGIRAFQQFLLAIQQ